LLDRRRANRHAQRAAGGDRGAAAQHHFLSRLESEPAGAAHGVGGAGVEDAAGARDLDAEDGVVAQSQALGAASRAATREDGERG
jgi:hypothetical protein